MIQPNDISSRQAEIRMLIAHNKLELAAKRLLDFATDFSGDRNDINEIVVIVSNYRHFASKERAQVISESDAMTRRNQILFQMLGFMDNLVDRLSVNSSSNY